MSAFLTVVKLFAFDLLGYGGEGPDGALLIVQLFLRLLAELFAGDEFRHEVHILSNMAVGVRKNLASKLARRVANLVNCDTRDDAPCWV